MPNKFNPFRPGNIVAPGMFSGRAGELQLMKHCLVQTKHRNPQHFLVEGERGIGKSSLFLVHGLLASGQIEIPDDDNFNFIVIDISLQENETYFGIIKRIVTELRKEILKRDQFKGLILKTWDFISKIEAAGFSYKDTNKDIDESEILFHLQEDLVGIIKSDKIEVDGIVILIDEADKPTETANLGLICKLLTEDLTKHNCECVSIGLAGLPNLIGKLRASHESSVRLFATMTLEPLENDERELVIERGIANANEKGVVVEITDEAKKVLATLSEGYPHFLQEFSYWAYEEDDDGVIDRQDVETSLFKENGSFSQLGKKYFYQYYNTPYSDDYRKVLDVMANHSDNWVQRMDIISESSLKPGTVDNALRALKGKDIIFQNPLRQGQYRIPTKSFSVWIRVQRLAQSSGEGDSPTLFQPWS